MAPITLPLQFSSTHQTSGLPGFPSVDLFGAPGTKVIAPTGGMLVYPHMIDWNTNKRVGGETGYFQTDAGNTFFLTHLSDLLPAGRVNAGQSIGTIAAVPGGAWSPHVHAGLHQGIYNPGGASDMSRGLSSAYAGNPLVPLIYSLAQKYNVDPQAALAVASTEGLGGGIGDSGTSFGPFQLHYGGAYPSHAPRGQAASQKWATSPAGVEYAIRKIAGVAGGLSGRPAVEAIVRRFERPANPGAEVSKAWSRYGSFKNVSSSAKPGAASTSRPSSIPSPLPDRSKRPNPFTGIFNQLMSEGPTKTYVDPFIYKPFVA